MKVAAYVRSSTDKQVASPGRQRAAIREHAERAGVVIVAWFEDVGVSGDDDDNRVGFRSMIDAAERGDFSRVVCFDRARFGRGDSLTMAKWTDRLRRARVTLETVADGRVIEWHSMMGRLGDAFAAELSAEYLTTLARNTVSGKLKKALDPTLGLPGQPPTYGRRRVVLSVGTNGRGIVSTSTVCPVTGPVVRRMFRDYAKAGSSVRGIAHQLNREGIPSMRGSVWSCSAVRGVLSNPMHAGDYVYGVRQCGRHASLGPDGTIVDRHGCEGDGRGTPIVHRDAVEPTVARELFDRVQQLLNERRRQTVPTPRVRVLSGIAACGACGQTMRLVDDTYRCIGDPRLGKACPGHTARQGVLTTAVTTGLRDAFTNPKRRAMLEAELIRQATATKRAPKRGRTNAAALDRQIADLNREIAAGTAKIPMMPTRAAVELGKHVDALAARRDTLVAERAAVETPTATPAGEGVAATVRAAMRVLERLEAAFADGDPRAANECLRAMGVRAALTVAGGRKCVRLTFGNPPRKGGTAAESLRLGRSCPP